MRRSGLTLSSLKNRLGPPSPPAVVADFDPAFYKAFYSDLKDFPGPALQRHFATYGRAEGRHPNPEAFSRALQAELGPLPKNFNPRVYRLMHADLREKLRFDWEGTEHYLRQGRKEKREYIRFDPDLYRSLYFPDKVVTDYELALHYRNEGEAEGRIGSWAEFIEQQGVAAGTWLDLLKVDEFELLNWAWAGRVESKLQAVRLFLAEGLRRLAPIAFGVDFDPSYYREIRPELKTADDQALYQDWLFRGLDEGDAGSAEQHLRRLGLPLQAYPAAFDWRRYLRESPRAGPDRWSALEHLLEAGFAKIPALPLGEEGRAEFLLALGERFRGKHDKIAAYAYAGARAAGDRSYASTHQLADTYYRLKRWPEAVKLFQEAAATPGAEVWTYVNGARAAIRIGAFRTARELLEAGRETAAGDPVWRTGVEELAEAYFTARTARARQLYGIPGGRERADALVMGLIERTSEMWSALDPLGAPTPALGEPRVVILANHDIKVCTHYRIEQKAELFELLGQRYEFYSLDRWRDFIAALPGASAAIFFRVPAWPSVTRAMKTARALEVPIYYEIDDLIFDAGEYPDTFESYGGLLTPKSYEGLLFGVPIFRAALTMSDYGIASTSPLAKAVEPLVRTGEVFVLPNGLDSRNEPFLDHPPPRVRGDDSIWIAYASGTQAHNTDFHELAGPALLEVLRRRKNVRFLLVGYLALTPEWDEVRDQIIRFDFVDGSKAFWSLLADADINIAVLKSTWATDSKSEIKWLEAAALGVPSVVSETAMYREVLEDGVDALVVRTPEEWLDALERMVGDADLRRRIAVGAAAKAKARYALEVNAERLDALLAPALQARSVPPPAAAGRRRILLANVWFPPQTIGGATRVLRNNLDAWLDSGAADAFEFMVVATDHGAAVPHRLRVDEYRGVPVVRIGAPPGYGEDWRAQDPEIGLVFAELVDAWRPDLVHFHALQRLTASVVEAARDAGVPYFVTTHDAWWVSDFPFLVDDQGRLRQPCEDLPRDPPKSVSVPQSLDRRRVLHATLEPARRIFGVSRSFAELHRACGYEQAIAVPNGVPPMPQVERTRSGSGRVRLAHVGNLEKHKGYHLVEAAVRQGGFKNLELFVIDHSRSGGVVERRTWGGTPVSFLGRIPQSHIHELYARTDVLLAPSIWPESFGLVTREALAAGCWVIASDRGAISEDVAPGVNGFVVDVTTVEGLLAALAAIDADPERYRSPPETPIRLRTSQEQAGDLVRLYRETPEREQPWEERPSAALMATRTAHAERRKAAAIRGSSGRSGPTP